MRKSYENTQIQEDLSDETLCRLAAEGRREAEEILVTRYQRLVRTCARPFFLIGGDSQDLTQEGMVGLIKAVREYDAEKEASFRTFAADCIPFSVPQGAVSIHRSISRSLWIRLTLTAIPTPLVPAVWLSAIRKIFSSTASTRRPSCPESGNSCPILKRRYWGII